jgi:hypothetical protein
LPGHFDKVEALFADYLNKNPDVSDNDRDMIQHYVDHNEFGIALDTAIAIHIDHQSLPSARSLAVLGELARLMEASDALKNLCRLSGSN